MCAIQGRCSSRLRLSGPATMCFPSSMTPAVAPRRYRMWDEAMSQLLTDSEVSHRLAGLPNWGRAKSDEPAIVATYELTDFVAALDFVHQVGHEAELMNHHPHIDIPWNKVTLVLSPHP